MVFARRWPAGDANLSLSHAGAESENGRACNPGRLGRGFGYSRFHREIGAGNRPLIRRVDSNRLWLALWPITGLAQCYPVDRLGRF